MVIPIALKSKMAKKVFGAKISKLHLLTMAGMMMSWRRQLSNFYE